MVLEVAFLTTRLAFCGGPVQLVRPVIEDTHPSARNPILIGLRPRHLTSRQSPSSFLLLLHRASRYQDSKSRAEVERSGSPASAHTGGAALGGHCGPSFRCKPGEEPDRAQNQHNDAADYAAHC